MFSHQFLRLWPFVFSPFSLCSTYWIISVDLSTSSLTLLISMLVSPPSEYQMSLTVVKIAALKSLPASANIWVVWGWSLFVIFFSYLGIVSWVLWMIRCRDSIFSCVSPKSIDFPFQKVVRSQTASSGSPAWQQPKHITIIFSLAGPLIDKKPVKDATFIHRSWGLPTTLSFLFTDLWGPPTAQLLYYGCPKL